MLVLALLTVIQTALETTPERSTISEALVRQDKELDNICLEYRLMTRWLSLKEGPSEELLTAIAESKLTARHHFRWIKNGQFQYWETLDDLALAASRIAWTDGESWYVFQPGQKKGTRQANSPHLYQLNPEDSFSVIEGKRLSQWFSQAGSIAIVPEPRYAEQGIFRAELSNPGYPPERLLAMVDQKISFRPRRVYNFTDDLLWHDYELKETETLPTGLIIPKRYRVLTTYYMPYGHFPVIEAYAESEAELTRWSTDDPIIAAITDPPYPPGIILYDALNETTGITGNDFKQGYGAWLNGEAGSAVRSSQTGRWWNAYGLNMQSGEQLIPMLDLTDSTCGPVALLGLLEACSLSLPELSELAKHCGTSERGTTVSEMINAGKRYGLCLEPVRFSDARLPEKHRSPFIAMTSTATEEYHYVLVRPTTATNVSAWQVVDFPTHVHDYVAGDVVTEWSGIALIPSSAAADLREQEAESNGLVVPLLRLLGFACLAVAVLVLVWRHRSHHNAVAAAFIAILITSCGSDKFSNAPNLSSLLVHPNALDIGTVQYQDHAEFTISLQNTSRNDVSIEDIVTGCACTVVNAAPEVITAETTAVVKMQFYAITRGPISQVVYIRYREKPEQTAKAVSMSISGFVPGHFVADPPRLALKVSNVQDVPRLLVVNQFLASTGDAYSFIEARSSHAWLKVMHIGTSDRAGQSTGIVISDAFNVVAQLDTGVLEEQLDGTITLSYNPPRGGQEGDLTEVQVPVRLIP